MTVIQPNSISGVTSITAQGGDINVYRADGTAADVTVNNITSGVITATTFKGAIDATTGTFSGNLGVGGVLTYEDVANIDSVGVITARSGINVTGGNITLGDSGGATDDRIVLGAGSDLQIYHDGSNSYIADAGTGDLIITGTVIRPRTDQFTLTNAAANEVMIQGLADGAVSLYHNASKKFETTAAGATVTGGLTVTSDVTVTSLSTFSNGLKTGTDDTLIRLGASDDLVMWHSSNSNSYIKNNTGELYIASDNIRLCTTDQSEKFIDCNGNGNVELYYDNSKKFETSSTGATVTGNLTSTKLLSTQSAGSAGLGFADNVQIHLGTGDDLKIYHGGTHSDIVNDTNELRLRSNDLRLQNNAATHNYFKGTNGGAAELYHNNIKTCETTRSGISLPKGVIHGVGNGSMAMIGGTINPSQDTTWNFPFNTNAHGTNQGYFFYVRVFLNHWNTGSYYKILEKYIGGRGNTTGYNAVTPLENNGGSGSSWNLGHFDCSIVLSGDGVQPATFKVTYDADGTPSWTSGYHICVQHSSIMGPPTIT